jgi:hypothetical protein
MMWKEAVTQHSKVQCQHSSGETEENQEKSQAG